MTGDCVVKTANEAKTIRAVDLDGENMIFYCDIYKTALCDPPTQWNYLQSSLSHLRVATRLVHNVVIIARKARGENCEQQIPFRMPKMLLCSLCLFVLLSDFLISYFVLIHEFVVVDDSIFHMCLCYCKKKNQNTQFGTQIYGFYTL